MNRNCLEADVGQVVGVLKPLATTSHRPPQRVKHLRRVGRGASEGIPSKLVNGLLAIREAKDNLLAGQGLRRV